MIDWWWFRKERVNRQEFTVNNRPKIRNRAQPWHFLGLANWIHDLFPLTTDEFDVANSTEKRTHKKGAHVQGGREERLRVMKFLSLPSRAIERRRSEKATSLDFGTLPCLIQWVDWHYWTKSNLAKSERAIFPPRALRELDRKYVSPLNYSNCHQRPKNDLEEFGSTL